MYICSYTYAHIRPYKESTQSNAASKQNADDDDGEGDSQQR